MEIGKVEQLSCSTEFIVILEKLNEINDKLIKIENKLNKQEE